MKTSEIISHAGALLPKRSKQLLQRRRIPRVCNFSPSSSGMDPASRDLSTRGRSTRDALKAAKHRTPLNVRPPGAKRAPFFSYQEGSTVAAEEARAPQSNFLIISWAFFQGLR